MDKPPKKHHFLFYIFQFDRKEYIMDAETEKNLRKKVHNGLWQLKRGKENHGER